jgi:hypothetical protein
MARIYVDLNDLVSQFREKFNDLSYKVGDLALLTTTGDSDVVQAINELDADLGTLQTQVDGISPLDSAGIIDLIGGQFPINTSDLADSSVTEVKMANDAIGSEQLKLVESLVIYDSNGTAIKTLYAAGI